jgi:pimeloyl-ACP methyl ester carboxylesterase
MSAVVVYVHGLWLTGAEAVLLRRRLSRQLGAHTRAFGYPSVKSDLLANVAALEAYLRAIPADPLHLVAHSLGGLLVLTLFERLARSNAGALAPGRVVLLGVPVRGSRSAQRLARWPGGRTILGKSAADGMLVPGEHRWPGQRELGIIAGDSGLGLGRLLGPMELPNDGTVLVAETQLPGAKEHLTLRTSHSGMVFSAAVARQTAAFLRDGRFAR